MPPTHNPGWHRESPGAGTPVGMGGGLLWWTHLNALRPLEWPGISDRCDMYQSQRHLEGTQSIAVNPGTKVRPRDVSYRPGEYPAGKPPAWDAEFLGLGPDSFPPAPGQGRGSCHLTSVGLHFLTSRWQYKFPLCRDHRRVGRRGHGTCLTVHTFHRVLFSLSA